MGSVNAQLCRLTPVVFWRLIVSMKRRVAFQNLHGVAVAIVEVERAELGSPKQEQRLLKEFAKAPQFRGRQVVLGVPHDGPLEADFSAPQEIRMALKKIGWLRLPFEDVELPDRSMDS
jgi:hypothetical protein